MSAWPKAAFHSAPGRGGTLAGADGTQTSDFAPAFVAPAGLFGGCDRVAVSRGDLLAVSMGGLP